MPKKSTTPKAGESIVWTGKNLADVRKFHKDVQHYPDDPNAAPHYRDASQHPDNLHVTTDDGHTLIVAKGDTIARDAEGRLTVMQTGHERPTATGLPGEQQYQASGDDTIKGKGGTR